MPARSVRFRSLDHNIHPKDLIKDEGLSWETVFKFLAGSISLMGVALTLIGFGVILARANSFGLEARDISNSPIEFLMASADFIVEFLNGYGDFFNDELLWFHLLRVDGAISAGLAVFIFACYRVRKRHSAQMQRLTRKSISILHEPLRKLGIHYVWYVFITFFGVIAPSVLTWILANIVMLGAVITIVILPFLGFSAEIAVIQKYILEPKGCKQFRIWNANIKKPANGAMCLRVLNKEGKEIARGRRIARNTEQLFLYQKATGKVGSIPIRDAIVEQVENEEAPIARSER